MLNNCVYLNPWNRASCHTKGCDSLSLSKGRYDETFAGEDGNREAFSAVPVKYN